MSIRTWTGAVSGDWGVAGNWQEGAVPVASDDVYFRNNAVSVSAGLDQHTITLASLTIESTYTGLIGLSTPTYLRIGATTVTIGGVSGSAVQGAGSQRILLDFGSVQTTVTVLSSSNQTADPGLEPIRFIGTHASNKLYVLGGRVGVATTLTSDAATLAEFDVNATAGQAAPVLNLGPGVTLSSATGNVNGGTVSIKSALATLVMGGGQATTSGSGTIAINKALRFNYLDAKRTWPIWCEKKFAPDFKTINSIALSEAPSMVSADEGAELKYVSLSDSKETGQLKTYKAGIKLTRNSIINDDMDAFNAIPRLQANAAARLEDDTAYALITANAAMADTGLLFNATAVTTAGGHANNTTSGGAPSVANLQIGSTAMKKQKGLKNVARLELQPKFLLVPSSIEETTKELIGSDTLIASQSSSGSAPLTVGNKNPYFNRYQVVGSVRLDDNSTTAWYLIADYRDGQIGTFQLYFLTDEPEPVLRQETDFDTEDVKYLVRHTVAGLVPDFRGAYRNNGA